MVFIQLMEINAATREKVLTVVWLSVFTRMTVIYHLLYKLNPYRGKCFHGTPG